MVFPHLMLVVAYTTVVPSPGEMGPDGIYALASGIAISAFDLNSPLDGPEEGQRLFRFFDDLRDKHIAHDENSLSAMGATLSQPHVANLHLLITKALEWVVVKFNALREDLTAELEKESLETLGEGGKRRKGF